MNRSITFILICLLAICHKVNSQACKGPLNVTMLGSASQGPIVVDESTSDVYCTESDQGAIDLTVTGGTPEYICQWAHDTTSADYVSDLASGTYSVTVTDANGCSESKDILIDYMDPLADSLSLVDYTACGNCYLFDGTQSFFYEDDQYIGAVIDIESDLDLGNTQVCADVSNKPGELYGYPTLPRCWTVLTDSSEQAHFRLFFTTEELDLLAYEIGAASGTDLIYNRSLVVNVYPLTDDINNAPAEYELYAEDFTITLYDEENGVWSLELSHIENAKITVFARQGVLPVELLSFEGEAMDKFNHLTWETGTESNTEGFYLQRSENGVVFDDLAFVEAGDQYYTYDDNDPIIGDNFYRLRIVDLDGTQEYSHIVRLRQERPFTFKIVNNPVADVLHIETESNEPTELIISVIGINGQILINGKHDIQDGLFRIALDMEHLTSGTYIIRVTERQSKFIESKKVVKI